MRHRYADLHVRADDDGIRPAGLPDECFYCREKIGRLHSTYCVMIRKEVELEASFRSSMMTLSFRQEVPHFWDDAAIVFRYNESTWCADSLEVFCDGLKKTLSISDSDCLCSVTTVRLVRVVDAGPYVNARQTGDAS
jgi:hypothetical protein